MEAGRSRATACTAAAAPTTATPRSPRCWPSRPRRPPASPTPGCVVLIEASEESGSPDLPAYLEALADRIGTPELVLCLDSGCLDYERLWVTTSLRGLAAGELRVDILTEGVHSGEASGVVPSSFRIPRQLLDRIEDSADRDDRCCPSCTSRSRADRSPRRARPPPSSRSAAADFPFAGSTAPDDRRPGRAAARPHLASDAQRHRRRRHPADEPAGNVLRPATSLAAQLPPARRRATTTPRWPPSSGRSWPIRRTARTSASSTTQSAPGWNAPTFAPWLQRRARRRVDGARSASRRGRSARAARSRSWACSARCSPTRSSSSPACSGRAATPTAPTSSSTCRRPAGSPSAWPGCSTPTPVAAPVRQPLGGRPGRSRPHARRVRRRRTADPPTGRHGHRAAVRAARTASTASASSSATTSSPRPVTSSRATCAVSRSTSTGRPFRRHSSPSTGGPTSPSSRSTSAPTRSSPEAGRRRPGHGDGHGDARGGPARRHRPAASPRSQSSNTPPTPHHVPSRRALVVFTPAVRAGHQRGAPARRRGPTGRASSCSTNRTDGTAYAVTAAELRRADRRAVRERSRSDPSDAPTKVRRQRAHAHLMRGGFMRRTFIRYLGTTGGDRLDRRRRAPTTTTPPTRRRPT